MATAAVAVAARKRANRAFGVRVVLHAWRFVAEEERETVEEEEVEEKEEVVASEGGNGGLEREKERLCIRDRGRSDTFFSVLFTFSHSISCYT